jgi:hypothetical protein
MDSHGTLSCSQREKIEDPANQKLVALNYSLMELLTQKGQPVSIYPRPPGDLTRIMDLCNRLEFKSLIDRPEWYSYWLGASSNVPRNVSAGRPPSSGEV